MSFVAKAVPIVGIFLLSLFVAARAQLTDDPYFGVPRDLWKYDEIFLIVEHSPVARPAAPAMSDLKQRADAGDIRAQELRLMHYWVFSSEYFDRIFQGSTAISPVTGGFVDVKASNIEALRKERNAHRIQIRGEIEQLAAKGSQLGRYLAALNSRSGSRNSIGGPDDEAGAQRQLEALVAEGYMPAARFLGERAEDRRIAISLLEKCAGAGDPRCMALLALRGAGPGRFRPLNEPMDFALASKWLLQYEASEAHPAVVKDLEFWVNQVGAEIRAHNEYLELQRLEAARRQRWASYSATLPPGAFNSFLENTFRTAATDAWRLCRQTCNDGLWPNVVDGNFIVQSCARQCGDIQQMPRGWLPNGEPPQ